ncbi:SCO6880 family protein [Leifsonia shinshuensis]|uniref:Type VII secretion system protein EccE domain-containing protein n=1 Tax=Leifsonia shinshuensis TaxID=150026 RepID=A0A7G6YHD2_9MICO|nr:SCO6880 family protein [Leifsonia shinshuensis]QNE37897.1 hypothetical protein F1C12_21675 [Leifsonia shinshuensis]
MSAEQIDKPREVSFPARRRAGFIGNFSNLQVGVAASGVVLVVVWIMFHLDDPIGALTVALLPGSALVGVGLWSDEHGHPLINRFIAQIGHTMRTLLGQTEWRRPVVTHVEKSSTFQLPGGLGSITAFETELGEAIFEDRVHGTFIAVLAVTTPGYALLDDPQKRERVDSWALFQSSLVKHPGLARIQVLLTSRVSSPTAIRDYYEPRASQAVSGWARQQYEVLLDNAVANSPQHEQFIVVVLDKDRLARDVKAQGGGRVGLANVMAREVDTTTGSLRDCGITVRSWLGAREGAAVMRKAYDPQAADAIENRTDARAGVAPASAGPIWGKELVDHLRTDGAFHATYEVTEWPRIPTLPDFLRAVTTLPFQHSASLYFTPVPLKTSRRRIRAERRKINANRLERQRRGNDRADDEFEIQEQVDITRREQELVHGFGDLEFLGLVTVTGLSKEELDANCSAFTTAAEGQGMEVRLMYGQQLAAFNSASLPLALAPSATSSLRRKAS